MDVKSSHGHGPGAALPGTKPGTDQAVTGEEQAHHPAERTYITVAAILSVVAALEEKKYYIDAVRDVLVPTLLILSLAKFIAVVGYFMHLKMDDRRFRWMFISGLVVAATIILALMVMFAVDEFTLTPAGFERGEEDGAG